MQRSSGYGERLILTPGSENKEGMGEGDSQTRAFSLESSTHKQADQRTTQTIHMQVTEAKTGSQRNQNFLISCPWVTPWLFFLPLILTSLQTVFWGFPVHGRQLFNPSSFLKSEPREASAFVPSLWIPCLPFALWLQEFST